MAIASDLVRGDMIEAIEFPHLANKYQVMGVPRSVFNENVHQEGAVPEPVFLARLLQSVGKVTAEEVEEMLSGPPPGDEGHEHSD